MDLLGMDPSVAGVFVTAVAPFIAAVFSLIIGLINWRHRLTTHHSETDRYIEHLYDKIIDYRLLHPEVLALSRRWEPKSVEAIYRQASEEDRNCAVYYGYIELCIGFCNAVLLGWRRGNLDRTSYEIHYGPLVKLLLTEHYPAMSQFSGEGKYVSSSIPNFIKELESKGWNWQEEHALLTKFDPPPEGA